MKILIRSGNGRMPRLGRGVATTDDQYSDELPWGWIAERCGSNVYESPPYLRAWLHHHLGSDSPWNMVFTESPSVIDFVAPLILHRERCLWITVRTLKPIAWNLQPSSVCIPFSASRLRHLAGVLLERRVEWDTLELVLTLDDPAMNENIVASLENLGLRLIGHTATLVPYISLGEPWAVYYRRRSQNLRKNISRLLNKLDRAGTVRHVYLEGNDASDALDVIFALHHKRWAKIGQRSKYSKDRHRNFLKALSSDCTCGMRGCVYSLDLNGRVIASALCLAKDRKLFYYLPTFDIDFSEFSPGKVLIHHIVRDASEKGFSEFDLGPGEDGYKQGWANGERTMCRLVFSHKKSLVLWTEKALIPPAKRVAKHMLRRLGIVR